MLRHQEEMQQEGSTEKFKDHLRILDKKKKSKFVHFELSDIPEFMFKQVVGTRHSIRMNLQTYPT